MLRTTAKSCRNDHFMNRFYFKNKNNPQKKCFEVYGIDAFTGIRYSLALCGSRNAAQKALDEYLVRIQPYDHYIGTPHQYEGLLFVEQTTIGRYVAHRHKEFTQRIRLRMSYRGELLFVNRHADEIMANIISCKDLIGSSDFQIGNESDLDTLERLIAHCTNFRIVKRCTDKTLRTIELAIELVFAQSKNQEYSYDNDIPDVDTLIQNQHAVVFKGTDDEFGKIVGSPLFAETCIGFFHQAIKNHYYGFNRINYLYETPVYKDHGRTEDEFRHCFRGLLTGQGHYNYMPRYKKIWYD